MRNNETRQSAYIPYRYTKNFKGHRWSNTRMLTDKYLKLFDKKKYHPKPLFEIRLLDQMDLSEE